MPAAAPPAWMSATMTVAMMVAMMLPSLAPTLARYQRDLRGVGAWRATRCTLLFAAGYAMVWAAIGLGLFALSITTPVLNPWPAGALVVCAGALQLSAWKSNRLRACRRASTHAAGVRHPLLIALQRGCSLGVRCGVSCAPAMAVLLVAGLMNLGAMAVITAAITAERVTAVGPRVARFTGGLTFVAGLAMCVHALALSK